MKRLWWFSGWMILALLLSGCGIQQSSEFQTVQATLSAVPEAETATPVPTLAAAEVILMDGEIKTALPALKLTFPGSAAGELLQLEVEVGQRVRAGDRIATLDDEALQQAVADAELALARAIEDRDEGLADNEETYQQQIEDTAENYARAQLDAQRALENAQTALARARLQPPTLAVAEAQNNLARAQDMEAQAHDEYKKSLDRPWEPQSIRDSLYKEWQQRISDREMAELRLKDAQTSLQAYYFDLETKAKDVENAQADLERVKQDEVRREKTPNYERTIEDAQMKLDDARTALADAELYAPWDGLVVSIDATVGSEVNSSTPIVTLLNLEQLYFVTENLSERHVAQLEAGQRTNITLRAYPDVVLGGRVDSVIPQQGQTTNADARFEAYISLDENDLDLLPGMTGRVEVLMAE